MDIVNAREKCLYCFHYRSRFRVFRCRFGMEPAFWNVIEKDKNNHKFETKKAFCGVFVDRGERMARAYRWACAYAARARKGKNLDSIPWRIWIWLKLHLITEYYKALKTPEEKGDAK